MYTTGVPTCDQLREVAFTGNVIPQNWYRIFVKSDLKHPKPHLLAINILADIVYWYRPREIRDEGTGQILGYQKKFRDDLLQRSYSQIAEQFGCSSGQAKDAIVFLEEMGVVRREFRTLRSNGIDVGITISGIQFVKRDDEHFDILFDHTVNHRTYQLHLADESDGTQKLFNVLPLVIIALTEGRLLVLDELDAKLHPKLLRFLIMLFKNPEINQHQAQLIFTSHDISTMKSAVFRTDEIWFAYKKEDEASDLYSLYELRDENGNHIGPNTAYDKQYLEGRYGADPYFRSMMEWR